jgi:hypothetical protein
MLVHTSNDVNTDTPVGGAVNTSAVITERWEPTLVAALTTLAPVIAGERGARSDGGLVPPARWLIC